MSVSRTLVKELREPDTAAWTALLQQVPSLQGVRVTDARVEPLNGHGVTRYLLAFDDSLDPVPFVGKLTSVREANFYRELAPSIRRILARNYLAYTGPEMNWIVLEDVPNHRPHVRWSADDVERVIALLASFHGAFWDSQEKLAGYDWLPRHLDRDAWKPGPAYLQAWQYWDRFSPQGAPISSHAIQAAGNLAPLLIRAATGFDILRHLGGWPGVVTRRHLEAVAELLDDPLPVLQPLRELPVTLLHGNMALHHWHFSLLQDQALFDWRNVCVGPPICDLVEFLEQVALFRARVDDRSWPVSTETMVDSYLLRMHVGLSSFDARAMRQALPAARCLFVLTTWLPRLADWFEPFVNSPLTWQALIQMDDDDLERAGYGRMAGFKSYLAELFPRFWHASKLL